MDKTKKYYLSKNFISAILKELKENEKFNPEFSRVVKILSRLSSIKEKDRIFWVKKALFLLTTVRNKLLITSEDQKKLKNTSVAFFGLSVGSHAAITWMMISRANKIKISDPDIISLSNLNRLRFSLKTLDKLKVNVVKDQLVNINPDCKIYSYKDGGGDAVKKIILGKPKPDIIVDSMDDLKSKILVRLLAKKEKIPVLMATDVGDNVFLDIERYDKFPQPLLFNGRVKGIENIDFSQISNRKRVEISMQIVGLEHNSEEMLKSLLSIGKSIKTWPQLGSTATIAGGLIATVIKKIVLGENINSGRFYLLLDDLLVDNFNSKKRINLRKNLISELTSTLD